MSARMVSVIFIKLMNEMNDPISKIIIIALQSRHTLMFETNDEPKTSNTIET